MKKSYLPFFIIVLLALLGITFYILSSNAYRMPMMMGTGDNMEHSTTSELTSKYFPTSIEGIPEAQAGQEVRLSNGETYDLTAAPVKKTINGKVLRLLAYNGTLPGPRIRVRQGDEITVNFHNNTDVETTLHPHGVRVENAFDGVVDVTQKAVKPGESFTYKLRFPDAGTFWYHPHVRDDYQQESGLYANFFVEPREGAYAGPVNNESFLFLDDILLDDKGLFPFPSGYTDFSLMGRFGNQMLVNWDTNFSLTAQKGEVKRLFLTNSANTRTFNFSIPGARMKLVGSDGGKYEHETFVDSVIIAPSERFVVDVYFPKAGTFLLQHKTPERTYTLGKVEVTSTPPPVDYTKEFQTLRSDEETIKQMAPLKAAVTKAPDKELLLSMTMGMGGMDSGMLMDHGSMGSSATPEKIEWEDTMASMNQMSTSTMMTWKIIDKITKKENMDIDWSFRKGDMVKIRITNDGTAQHPMQHPFHMHGQRFVVLATNGMTNDNLVWKDSVLIQRGDTMDILVDMSNPGTWMAHCHIAEHLHSGMMFGFTVKKT